MKFNRCIVLTLALIAVPAVAHAQTNHQSDVAGVVVSGGDVVGGIFAVPGQVVTLPTAAATAMVNAAIGTIAADVKAAIASVMSGAAASAPDAAPGAAGGTGTGTPGAAPMTAALASVLGCSSACGASVQSLATALEGTGGTAMSAKADALAESLQGLAAVDGKTDAPTVASNVRAARVAFVRLVQTADESYLTNPPAELVTVHAMLVKLLTAAGAK